MSKRPHAPPLYKQKSLPSDLLRDVVWQRRKDDHATRGRLSKSLSEDDLQELKACIELGFRFDSHESDPKLSSTIPALELFHAVNKQYNHSLSRTSSSSSFFSDTEIANTTTIFNPGDDLDTKKTRLKQWAQVVACAVWQSSYTLGSFPNDQVNQ